ncbi:Imm8 family immunity protein [Asticcacaulis taihuensis]|uniref:Immunity protein 8 n=1 Tax=Asticcacaulis taihuensis TaxID=260084 RepID=A0A1G4TP49_9CAUL|nr:Imm8 family immunity protein [Asticcacaulis taihuensis]SCW82575.1 Immunity protein 8 [Asticcacaulis taihuensis]
MINPVIKDISSTDWNGRNFSRSLPECIWFHVEIGEQGKDGADLFQIGVCNLPWAQSKYPNRDYVLTDQSIVFAEKYVLVLDQLNAENLTNTLARLIGMSGPYSTWQNFGKAMSDYMMWEYEETGQ